MSDTGSFSLGQTNGDKPKGQLSFYLKLVVLIVVLIVTLPLIVRLGYCQGWWLKSSPWAYYWWLCDCGPELEQSLYPINTEIVVSACLAPQEATLSSDGRYMIVSLGSKYKSYLFDFVTGEKHPWLSITDVEFWTDTFARARTIDLKKNLVDVTDNSIINLTTFSALPEDNRLIVPPEALQAFQERDNVLILDGLTEVVLTLDSEPKQNPGRNYALFFPEAYQKQLEAILSANGIDYDALKLCSWVESVCPSHDGRFIATNQQIFTSDEKLLTTIRNNPSFSWGIMLIGWAHDNSGVYLQPNPHSYIIDGGGFVFPNLYRLPQPIIKLKVPPEYFQTELAPEP